MAIYTGRYVGAKKCTNGPQPGAYGAMDWYRSAYRSKGGVSDGIYNCRSVRGGRTTSIHGEGRAMDFGVRPYGASYGTALANKIVAMSKELGVQCVIWNRKIWSSAYPHSGWRAYHGKDPHTGHLHVELTWAAANQNRKEAAAKWARVLGGAPAGGGGGSKPKPKQTTRPKGEVVGPKHPFPLGGKRYFGPKNRGNNSVSGFYKRKFKGKTDQHWLKEAGAQFARRGWSVGKGKTYLSRSGNDGLYGAEYAALIRAFQKDQGLTVDGLLGKATWDKLFFGKVT